MSALESPDGATAPPPPIQPAPRLLAADQMLTDAQAFGVSGGPLAVDHQPPDTQTAGVGGDPPPVGPIFPALPNDLPDRPEDALLLIYADALDDLERVRIATENRVRSLRQAKDMEGTPEADRMAGLVDALTALEHGATLELKRALRKHPLGPWVKRTVGVGEKQAARLLAAIGDPADRQTVSQLWAYCGLHVWQLDQRTLDPQTCTVESPPSDPGHTSGVAQSATAGVAPRTMRGQKANWNATAKMRAFLVAESCIKQRTSPYRAVYEAGRQKYAEATHPVACPRCGPSGKPAPEGSPLSAGHQHARAMRLVMKAILRDLWIEARQVREASA